MRPEKIIMAQAVANPRRRFVAMGALGCLCGIAALCRGAAQPNGPDGPVRAASSRTPQAEETALLCSPRNAAGVGLRGEYYERENRAGQPLLVRTDGVVATEAVSALAQQPGGLLARSARWNGWVKAPLPGLYRFHFDHADARVVVGAMDFSLHAATPQPAGLDMTAGRFYPITVELNRIGEPGGKAQLEWTPPHGHRFLISRAMLFLPMAS
jgi:hypothetical protein